MVMGGRTQLQYRLLSVVLGVMLGLLAYPTLYSVHLAARELKSPILACPSCEDSGLKEAFVTPEDVEDSKDDAIEAHLHKMEAQLRLLQKVKVLVWVMTQPKNHQDKAVHVKETWGKRVDKLLFMSTEEDPSLPTVNLNMTEGRDRLWNKTKAAFKYVYDHHLNDYDWFMKADDDTFVVVENLRYLLTLYDPDYPIYFGSRLKKHKPPGYMSGGGGYVLSRAALVKFVEEGLGGPQKCENIQTHAEDRAIGICLTEVGVLTGDSRDDLGRRRFFPLTPAHHLIPGVIEKRSYFWSHTYYPLKVGLEYCSDTAITFHYISPDKMRELEYLLYHLRPFGIVAREPFPPRLPPDLKSVPKQVIERFANSTS